MALPISTLLLLLPLTMATGEHPNDDVDDPNNDGTRNHMGSRATRRTVATFFMFGIGFFMSLICCAYVCIPILRDKRREEGGARRQVASAPSRIECGSFDGSGAASGDGAGWDMGTNDAAGMARADEPE